MPQSGFLKRQIFVTPTTAYPLSVVDGNERELRSYIEVHRTELVALAIVMTGCREAAQDAVHDSYVRLLRSGDRNVANVQAYVRRAVINECGSAMRRRGRSARRMAELASEWERSWRTQPDPHGRVEVLSALAHLSHKQRTVVVLRYYLAMSDEEIAAVVGGTPASVRSILSRSLHKLRDQLNGDDGA